MTSGTNRQQSRLLPYLLVVLVALLAYLVYTRVLQRPAPPAAVTVGPPAVATPAPSPRPAATPTTVAQPSPTPTATPVVPARPAGRSNPFAALVAERAATPATPPPPPPVPPPVFPGGTPRGAGSPGGPGAAAGGPAVPRAVGVLLQDGGAVGIVELAQKTYIVREGDVVEGFRVERIEDGMITLRLGDQRVEARLGGGEQR